MNNFSDPSVFSPTSTCVASLLKAFWRARSSVAQSARSASLVLLLEMSQGV